jgi:hypothetical protein
MSGVGHGANVVVRPLADGARDRFSASGSTSALGREAETEIDP